MTSDITFCACCGARFKEGEGWLDQHVFPCANQRHGWNFTVPNWTPPPPDKNRLAAIEDEKLSEGHVYKPRRTQRHE